MHERLFIARLFLVTGALLAVAGLVLWGTLPLPGALPPYLVTAVLALGYGVFCLWNREKLPAASAQP